MKVGNIYSGSNDCEYEVVNCHRLQHILVRSTQLEYPHNYITSKHNILKGSLRNPNKPSVYGIGYLGEGVHKFSSNYTPTKAGVAWKGMMRRCYGKLVGDHYDECTVHKDWHNFQVFAEWFYKQTGSDKGWQLDKDILIRGNKVYSEATCALVPKEINLLLTKGNTLRGEFPIGVYLCSKTGYYVAHMSKNNKTTPLGRFNNPLDAFLCYKKDKEDYIKYLANEVFVELPHNIVIALNNYEVLITD